MVALDGAPLAGARLVLIPNNREIKGPFFGMTDDQGRFTLGSIENPDGGIPTGAYRLTISTAFAADGSETAVVPPERVPAPYPTGVDFEVPDGGKSDANFDLQSK